VSTKGGLYRKPCTGMWNFLAEKVSFDTGFELAQALFPYDWAKYLLLKVFMYCYVYHHNIQVRNNKINNESLPFQLNDKVHIDVDRSFYVGGNLLIFNVYCFYAFSIKSNGIFDKNS